MSPMGRSDPERRRISIASGMSSFRRSSAGRGWSDCAQPAEPFNIVTAGSVLLFNGYLWHSGTRNDARGSRRVLQCQFVPRTLIRIAHTEPGSIKDLSPAARYFLHVRSIA